MTHQELLSKPWPTSQAQVSQGLPFPEACAHHVANTFGAKRVYVIASGSLARTTSHVKNLQAALGDGVVGGRNGMTPHTLWSECVSIAGEMQDLKADLVVTIGGGSLIDAAKIVTLALANNVTSVSALAALHSNPTPDPRPPTIPIISIPTTLSGGEYTSNAGGTDDSTHHKYSFRSVGPSLIILDPALTTTTPPHFWLSTGIRAVDHCVEAMCNLECSEDAERDAAEGLRFLVPGLLACKRDPKDLEARLRCLRFVGMAMRAVVYRGAKTGGSHAIGHQLGPLGVGHGETSCVMLPAVCRFNIGANEERQERVKAVLVRDEVVRAVLGTRGVDLETADLCDVLDAVIRELGLPRSLKEVGVDEEKFDDLAEGTLRDRCAIMNPIPLTEKGQVFQILKMALL